MTARLRHLLVAVTLPLLLLVAACQPAASPSTSAGASATPEASIAPTGAPEPTPSGSGATTGGLDLSGSADALNGIDSYKIAIDMTGIVPSTAGTGKVTLNGTIVTKDDAAQLALSGIEGLPAESMTVIIIGQDAWIDMGTGTYIPSPGGAGTFDQTFAGLSPTALFQQMQLDQFGAQFLKLGDEHKNGVSAGHYEVKGSLSQELSDAIGPDGIVDVWVAEDGGYVVAMTMNGQVDVNGTKQPVVMSIDITDINNPANKVEAPA
jgi:hypothetical protein